MTQDIIIPWTCGRKARRGRGRRSNCKNEHIDLFFDSGYLFYWFSCRVCGWRSENIPIESVSDTRIVAERGTYTIMLTKAIRGINDPVWII